MSSKLPGTLVLRNGHPEMPPMGDMNRGDASPFVTIAALLAAVRRRWRLCFLLAVIGVVAAAGLSFASPLNYSATAIIQVGHATTSNPSRAMLTDAELVRTRTVAQGAVRALGGRISPRELVDATVVEILSDDLLGITVAGPTQRAAVQRADAVASSFLSFRRDVAERQLGLNVETIERRKQALVTELNDVNNAISAGGTAPGSAPSVQALGELLVRRSSLNDQITALTQRIRDTTNESGLIIDNSRVIDPPTADGRPVVTAMIGNLAAGIVAGLALAVAWILTHEIIFDRVRRRADAASVLGVPVPVSVGRLRTIRKVEARRGKRLLAHPDPPAAKVVAYLRESLASDSSGRRALAVISIRSDRAAATAVATLATELAQDGDEVLLVDLTDSSVLAGMCGARRTGRTTVRLGGKSVDLVTISPSAPLPPDTDGPDGADLLRDANTVLLLATLDPAVGAAHLLEWARSSVAIVTAGRSGPTALHAASVMLASAGMGLCSAILLAADRNDETVGMVQGYSAAPPVGPPAAWAQR